MNALNYASEVRRFIVTNFLFGEDGNLANDTSFMETGVVDSTGVLELVAWVEGRYGIKVSDAEIVPENLDSIDRVADYVKRKMAEKDVPA